ncbi:hypothetical protein DSCA_60090 [Desulfosarcina alkanivorans]|uniref:Uncharacterized protein n=1 Tax=Desulfosarcina alkanivorans TaxID=571177 RepID=A0A5K7YVL7_9BACT|nr:hypothetical protein [Desulfosarcina alkanivorans]BBO72079.1 hypothetical protein DSCA_60090 [Desulfosarcina alkanivorans]
MDDRLKDLEHLAAKNRHGDDLGRAHEGDPEAISNITRFHHPRIFEDENLFEDVRYGVEQRLQQGKPNILSTYEEAILEVYEENNIPLPRPSAEDVENFNEQARFQKGVQELMEERQKGLE